MLDLPLSTVVNRRIPKESFYNKTVGTAKMRDMMRDQMESIVWKHKIAESTMAVKAGEHVLEIQVIEIRLRQREIDKRIISAIVQTIPYKLLLVILSGTAVQLWMESSGMFYYTPWESQDSIQLKFEGLDLDEMYANLVRQIARGRLGYGGNLEEAVERDKKCRKLEREIEILERKVFQERQFNRQVELNESLKRLKKELEDTSPWDGGYPDG